MTNDKEIEEKEAIMRMMVYLKYELLRNNMKEEADLISQAIELNKIN